MKYIISSLLSGFLWGLISLFLKPLSTIGFSPVQVMFFRAFISCVILFFIIFIKNKSLFLFSLKDIWLFIGSGVLSLTFFSLCYFTTIIHSGASIAVILLYTSPIFVLIFSFLFFKEKLSIKKLLALLLTFCGCIFVSGFGISNSLSFNGFIIGLGAGFGYALYSIFSKYALKKYNVLTVIFYTFVFSAISILPFCNIQEVGLLLNIKSSCLLVGIAIFCTILPYFFYTYGLIGLETSKAAIIVTIEPLVATIIGFTVWGEPFGITKLIGILFILVSIILLEL